MSYTLADAKSKITFWVDDLQKGYFTDTQLTNFISSAQYEVQKVLLQAGQNWYVTTAITQMVVGQRDYVLPSDFLHSHRLETIVSGLNTANELTNPLMTITINQQDIYPFSQGDPQGYFLKKNRLVLVPPPDNTNWMRLYYSYIVAPLVNDSDVIDVPDQFVEMVPIFAAIDCFIKDGRDASMLMAKKTFYEDMLKKEAQDRSQDGPRRVVSTSDGGFGPFF